MPLRKGWTQEHLAVFLLGILRVLEAFYCPFTKNKIEIDNAKVIEDIQNSGS